jgi:hypothetical protein
VAVVAAPTGSGARSALFFFFNPATAAPGDRVTVRTAGTPQSFELSRRVRPFQQAYRLYLVPNEIAGTVRSRFDTRLHFIGSLRPDRNGRGYWLAAGVDGSLTVQGGRMSDFASAPLQVHRVNRGTLSGYRGATCATPITFPTEGCWKLTARVKDVSLSFVVRVDRPRGA